MISIHALVIQAVLESVAREMAKAGKLQPQPIPKRKRFDIDWLMVLMFAEALIFAGAFLGMFAAILFALFPDEVAMLIRGWRT